MMQIPDGAKIKLSTWAWHQPVLGALLHPGAAHATESTTAATELGDNQDKSYLKSINKQEISYLDEQQIFGHS